MPPLQARTGKRPGRETGVNAVPGPTSPLIYVHDQIEKRKWLVDGGALVSIVPPTTAQRVAGPNDTVLQAANGTKIKCFGTVEKTVTIAGRSYPFAFIIADVRQSILGADFLAKHSLAPNHRDGNLIDLNSLDFIPATISIEETPSPINLVCDPFNELLDKYPAITKLDLSPKTVKHGVTHFIPTNCAPIQSRVRKLSPEKLAIAKTEIDKLVELGVCKRGKSDWASPLMVAPKPGGGWRVCGDYRRLNNATPDDKYPVRTLQDFTAELQGKTIFSKIDLYKGYHQIPVNPADAKKTAVITPFGLFVWDKTPFGLKNAGQDFQRMMDEILDGVPHQFVYIDDILVASGNPEEHLEDLDRVFKKLDENGLVVNRQKCVFGQPSLEFLGYRVDKDGISPLEDRVEAIRETPPPKTVKELQRFLGMVNYYRRFVPKAAQHLHALFTSLKGKPKTLAWTEECQLSFEAIKEALASATLLHHPRPGARIALTTDASKVAIGGVLEQYGPKGWEPLAFYSAKLQPNQTLWPPYDRELLAAFKSVRHFRQTLEGRNFTLFSDHQSLIPSLAKKTEPQTARQTYQLAGIAEYTTDIRYLKGKVNVVADALSRPPTGEPPQTPSTSTWDGTPERPNSSRDGTPERPTSTRDGTPQRPNSSPMEHSECVSPMASEDLHALVNSIGQMSVDLEEMARDQPLDPDYQRLAQDARTSIHFKTVQLQRNRLIVDVSNGPARPFVPLGWRRKVFDTIHGLGHPGVQRTRQAVAAKFVWPSMSADVSRWARECPNCQRAKVLRNVIPPVGEFQVPQKRFEHLNLDIVSLPTSNGYAYLLTAVDRFSRWPVAIPMKDITAESVADAFAHGWVATYGVPASITTDRGSQFSSAIWKQLLSTWGVNSHMTTAYHPEANGLVERFHRRLKEALLAMGENAQQQWYWRLPCVLLGIRTTLKPDIGASPADMVYGEGLAVPGTLLSQRTDNTDNNAPRQATLNNLRVEVERLQPKPTSNHRRPRTQIPQDLRTASHVFIRRGGVQPSLSDPYVGPFRVLAREDTHFRIEIPGRGPESVALARLKPAHMPEEFDEEAEPATPPSPPPPGRRPGWRTRQPAAADRVTRQGPQQQPQPSTSQRSHGDPPQASSQCLPGEREGICTPESTQTTTPPDAGPSRPRSSVEIKEEPNDSHGDDFAEDGPSQCLPPPPPTPRRFTKPSERRFSTRGPRVGDVFENEEDGSPPLHPPPPPPTPSNPRRFTKPSERRFSTRGPRINYAGSLRAIMQQHSIIPTE